MKCAASNRSLRKKKTYAACKPFGAALIIKQLEDMPEVKRSFRLVDAVHYDRLIHTSFADSLELKMPTPPKKDEDEIIPLPLKWNTEIGDLGCTVERITAQIVECQEKIIMQAVRFIGGVKFSDITIDKSKVVEAFEKATARKPGKHGICCSCGLELVKGQKYCSLCGQKIDWSSWQ